jgi:hypothetical protein
MYVDVCLNGKMGGVKKYFIAEERRGEDFSSPLKYFFRGVILGFKRTPMYIRTLMWVGFAIGKVVGNYFKWFLGYFGVCMYVYVHCIRARRKNFFRGLGEIK